MDLADGGRVAIELAPEFAPAHVANIRALARAGWWNGAAIYRVQDNYVVQWGVNESDRPLPEGVVKAPPAEYHRALEGLAVRPLGFPDSYAPMAGQIGRAPCRERVCRSVEISVVAVSLKKNYSLITSRK